MTKQELLRLMRLLSAVESAMFMSKERMPQHLHDEVEKLIEVLEREILK